MTNGAVRVDYVARATFMGEGKPDAYEVIQRYNGRGARASRDTFPTLEAAQAYADRCAGGKERFTPFTI